MVAPLLDGLKMIPVKVLPLAPVVNWIPFDGDPLVPTVVAAVTPELSGCMPAPTRCRGLSKTNGPATMKSPPLR